jgi:hypothetical protein
MSSTVVVQTTNGSLSVGGGVKSRHHLNGHYNGRLPSSVSPQVRKANQVQMNSVPVVTKVFKFDNVSIVVWSLPTNKLESL